MPYWVGSWANLCKITCFCKPAHCVTAGRSGLWAGQALCTVCSKLAPLYEVWCAQNCSASSFPLVPGSADLFTCMSSLSEVTGSCRSLPVWHYLRYFSGNKVAISCGLYLLWKTHFVTMEGRAGTQPSLGLACGELKFVSGHTREGGWSSWGVGEGLWGLLGNSDRGIQQQPLVLYTFLSLSHAFWSCLHSSCIQSRSHKQRSSPSHRNDDWGLSRCAL